jgi:microsomal dipeptidase-like Zn-dependent dipeptidase
MKKFLWTIGILILGSLAIAALLAQSIESQHNRIVHRPPYLASQKAISLHRQLTLVDLHADSLLWGRNLLFRSKRGHVDVPRLLGGNVAIQIFTVVTKIPKGLNLNHNRDDTDQITRLAIVEGWPPSTWSSLKERALYQAGRLRTMSKDSDGKLVMIETSDELGRFLALRDKNHGIVGAVLGLEGAHALQGDLNNLDVLFDAGFRVISLTHFFDNDLAGSSTGAGQAGLTPKGRELVHRMEAKHMVIDLAHASPATIDDVTAIATRPVIVSHTGVRGTCNNPRNLYDKQIREVANTGGVVGIGYWNTAICGTDASAIARAIRYVVTVAGIEHVAIGSDFDGSTTVPFDSTGVVQITDALLSEGFSERGIRLIMGENSVRVLRQTLP